MFRAPRVVCAVFLPLPALWAGRYIYIRMMGLEWTKQAIISFDGGGIRGYGSLLILRALMEKVEIEERRTDPAVTSSFSPCMYKPTKIGFGTPYTENIDSFEANIVTETDQSGLSSDSLFLPCPYFDYGAGTSTGGLISIMLFCLRMTVHDCIREYEFLGDSIFGHPRPCSWFGILWPKYSSGSLKKVINEATARHSTIGYVLNYEIEKDLAQCIVVAYPDSSARGDVPYLFRTYEPPPKARDDVYEKFRSDPQHHPSSIPLHKVARATAAAPAYFRPVRILPAHRGIYLPAIRFKDGGFGCNNPSEEAFHDVREAHGGLTKHIGPFISIGTGVGKFKLFSSKRGNFRDVRANVKAALKTPTLTTLTHKSMLHLAEFDREKRFPYYRFDGGEDLGEIALDEWEGHPNRKDNGSRGKGAKTLETIRKAVQKYLQVEDVQRNLEQVAELLVQRRRLRAEDASRWERFATSSYYLCGDNGCDKEVRFDTSEDLKGHLMSVHAFGDVGMLEKKLEEGRRYGWLYPS